MFCARYHLKYNCSSSKKDDAKNIKVNCVKHTTSVSFSKDEKELSGQFVASLGEQEITWQTLYRCNVTITASRTNINARKDSDSESEIDDINFDEPPPKLVNGNDVDSAPPNLVDGSQYVPGQTALEQSFFYKNVLPWLRYGAAIPLLWSVWPYVGDVLLPLVLIAVTIVVFQKHFQ